MKNKINEINFKWNQISTSPIFAALLAFFRGSLGAIFEGSTTSAGV